jgi:hypothetical protein
MVAFDGERPVAVAVLVTNPASRSACTAEYVAVHVVDAPGASVVARQTGVDVPESWSMIERLWTVTFPELVTEKCHVRTSPTAAYVVGVTVFSSVRPFDCVTGIVTDDVADTVGPGVGTPVAVPVLLTWPASRSAWVVTYVAEQVMDAPEIKLVAGQLIADRPVIGSVTVTAKVSLPVLVTW